LSEQFHSHKFTQKSFRTPQKIYAKNPRKNIQKIQNKWTKKIQSPRKREKNPKKLQKKVQIKSKKSKNLEKIWKIAENPKFFPFSDLNLRTLKCRVVNPRFVA